jgi:hypothetical protein
MLAHSPIPVPTHGKQVKCEPNLTTEGLCAALGCERTGAAGGGCCPPARLQLRMPKPCACHAEPLHGKRVNPMRPQLWRLDR